MMTAQEQRAAVRAEALTWERTPFMDYARLKGKGVDCGQILIGVFNNAINLGIPDPPKYSRQHMMHSDHEFYIELIEKWAKEVPESRADVGDIVIYKIGRTYSHAGILIDPWPGEIINAVTGVGVVRSHGTKEGFLRAANHWARLAKQSAYRFFSCWA